MCPGACFFGSPERCAPGVPRGDLPGGRGGGTGVPFPVTAEPPPPDAAPPAGAAPANDVRADVQVAEGVLISPGGEVSVDEGLTDVLLDLAEALEDRTGRPVDVEHVVAAVVLANRAGNIGSGKRLRTGDDLLLMALAPHVEAVFEKYGGRVAEEEEGDDGDGGPTGPPAT